MQVDSPRIELERALARYRQGDPRGVVYRDLVLGSVRERQPRPVTLLDIGCGHGFSGNADLQQSLATSATRFVGVEPDRDITPPAHFHEIHPCRFEDARLPADSIDVAYANFVLEHVEVPTLFWQKLHECLAPGGVFWGFTVDGRHPFGIASILLGKLRLKDLYLDWLRGRRGEDRYENYPTHYRANSPAQIRPHVRTFRRADFLSVHRVGQLQYYFPPVLWRPLRLVEWLSIKLGLPGSMLLVRLEKQEEGVDSWPSMSTDSSSPSRSRTSPPTRRWRRPARRPG